MYSRVGALLSKLGARLAWFPARIDALWGYDVFISHRRSDGADYARALHKALIQERPRVSAFIDADGFGAGDPLYVATRIQAAKSSLFLLVGSPQVLVRRSPVDWVETELREYLATHKAHPKVLVVDFGSVIGDAIARVPRSGAGESGSVVDQLRQYDFLRAEAPLQDLYGAPSPQVLESILNKLAGRRRDRSRLLVFEAIALVLFALLIGVSYAAFRTREEQAVAIANESRSLAALAQVAANRHRNSDAIELALASWPRSSADSSRVMTERDLRAVSQALADRAPAAQLRHKDDVSGAVFSRDGRWILSLTHGGSVVIWAASNDRPLQEMKHDWNATKDGSDVFGAIFDREEKRVLSWGRDDTLRLWDASTGLQIGRTMHHQAKIKGAVFDADERRILSWSSDETARLWDVSTGYQIGLPMRHDSNLNGAMFNARGDRVLSWSLDHTARLWDASTGLQIAEMPLEANVAGATFDADESRILSWSNDGVMQFWDAATGAKLGPAMKHEDKSSVGAVLYNGGRRILSWSSDGTLRRWDAESSTPIGSPLWNDNSGNIHSVHAVLGKSERRILSWSWGGEIRQWDTQTGAQIGPAMKHDGPVAGAVYDRRERRILSWSRDRTVRIWDAQTGLQIGPALHHESWVWRADFDPDERRVLTWADNDKVVRLWDVATGSQIGPALLHDQRVDGAVLDPGGKRILSWSWDKTARLWDIASGEPVGKPMAHGKYWAEVGAFDDSGQKILTWSSESVFVWDADGRPRFAPLWTPSGNLSVNGAIFGGKGARILAWGQDNAIHVFDASTGLEIGKPMLHDDEVLDATWNGDESRILSWSSDGAIRLWDAATHEQIGGFKHQGKPLAARFYDDEKRVVSWSEEAVHRWNVVTNEEILPAFRPDTKLSGAALDRQLRHILTWNGDTVQIWDLAAKAPPVVIRLKDNVSGASFFADGKLLTWSQKFVELWNASTGEELTPALDHGDPTLSNLVTVNGAVASADGKRILSWSDDRKLRLWDVATGAQIGPAMESEADLTGAAFNPDGKTALSWSSGTSVRLWDIGWSGDNIFAIACNHTSPHFDLEPLFRRYGVQVREPICDSGVIPAPARLFAIEAIQE